MRWCLREKDAKKAGSSQCGKSAHVNRTVVVLSKMVYSYLCTTNMGKNAGGELVNGR